MTKYDIITTDDYKNAYKVLKKLYDNENMTNYRTQIKSVMNIVANKLVEGLIKNIN